MKSDPRPRGEDLQKASPREVRLGWASPHSAVSWKTGGVVLVLRRPAMHRHLLLLALAVLLLADAALGAPVTFDSRFAAVLPAMGQADMGYLPSMMMASFMKKLRHDRPTEAKPEDDGGMAAMATTLGQAGSEQHGAGGVRALRGHSLRRMFGVNQKELMSDRVIPSPFWLDQFNEPG